jgi:LacI family transcriptional regulator
MGAASISFKRSRDAGGEPAPASAAGERAAPSIDHVAVTRNDVARAAGVSSAVVSYVLNDGPRPVSVGARQRVLDAIEQLGYRRDSVARSMRTRTTQSIGFVLPDITLSYFASMTQHITEAARFHGLTVIVATSNGSLAVERKHLTDLAGRRVDGVILMSVDPTQDLSWAQQYGLPVLMVDRPLAAINIAAAATTHLVEHGLERIGRVAAPADHALTQRRDAGWLKSLRSHGLSEDARLVAHTEVSTEGGYRAATQLLLGEQLPDGIVVDAAPQTAGFLRAAADLGVAIPGDLSLVACDFGSAGEYSVPRVSSVDSPIESIAARAVEAIRTAEPTAGLITITDEEFVLHARESCGHAASPADAADAAR